MSAVATDPVALLLTCVRADKHDAGTCLLAISAKPNAKKSALVGVQDAALVVRLQAPPVEGKANAALLLFVADVLDVPKRAVQLDRGDTSRHKQLRIALPKEDVVNRLAVALAAHLGPRD